MTVQSDRTISIDGEITATDATAFASAADKVVNTTPMTEMGLPIVNVMLDSPGGDVVAAEAIGHIIRSRFFFVAVNSGRMCASACVLILAAGVERRVGYHGQIIIHRPTFDRSYFSGLAPDAAETKYNAMLDDVRAYLTEMRMPSDLFAAMVRVPSTSGQLLSDDELDQYGLNRDDPAWAEKKSATFMREMGHDPGLAFAQCLGYMPGNDAIDVRQACLKMVRKRYVPAN